MIGEGVTSDSQADHTQTGRFLSDHGQRGWVGHWCGGGSDTMKGLALKHRHLTRNRR